jgi:hypothetical protein
MDHRGIKVGIGEKDIDKEKPAGSFESTDIALGALRPDQEQPTLQPARIIE